MSWTSFEKLWGACLNSRKILSPNVREHTRCLSDRSAKSTAKTWRTCWRRWTRVICTTSVAWRKMSDILGFCAGLEAGNWIQVVCFYILYIGTVYYDIQVKLISMSVQHLGSDACPRKFAGCFKPNECQKPAIFHETLVMDQLVQSLGMTWVGLGG